MGSLKFLNRKSRQFIKSFSSLHCFKFSHFTGYGCCYLSCMCCQGKRVSNDWILDRFDIPVPPITTWQLYVCWMWMNITDRHCKRKKPKEIHTVLARLFPQSPKPKLAVCSFSSPTWGTWPCSLVWFIPYLFLVWLICHVRAQCRYSQLKGNNGPVFGLLFVTVPIKDKLHGSLHCLDFGSFCTI